MSSLSVDIFSKPEHIDNFIKTKLSTLPRKGGVQGSKRAAWTKEELELRDAVIMEYITTQGLSKSRTAQQIKARWGVSFDTALRYVREAINRFSKAYCEETQEEQRRVWMERCEQILQDAIDTRDKQAALKALDIMGKSMGIYKETKQLDVDADVDVTFDFQ